MSLVEHVRATGLLPEGEPAVVLLSGGRDSVALLDCAVAAGAGVTALHVDYGLRPESGEDAAFCAQLCERFGVPLSVERPGPPRGNVQAWARDVRYAAALALEGVVATGHTATDQVETVLYRLAASPGRRALLGMRERQGRIVRPLLRVTREATAAHCRARGLSWREDASNASPAYARSRARADLVPALKALHPAAEANVLRTLELLRDEAEVLDAVVDEALATTPLRDLPPALRRLAFQRLAGEDAPAVGHRVDEVLDLAQRGGTRSLDLGGGWRAVVSYGDVRVERPGEPAPDPGPADQPVPLPVPGRLAWAGGRLSVRAGGAELPIGDGTLDAAACAAGLEVRFWRPGDRMRPLGLDGSKSLQDLLTDRKVPRAARRRLPVVVCGGEIAWVPGVATGERFRVTEATGARIRLAWEGG
jgi:tRNA(Ile)-lysidine synthase